MAEIKLTQYSHGAGCGCKISPAVLETMLHSDFPPAIFPSLLVGNESKDDAAVYEIGNGQCIISTTDFFMPIVDDPFMFGQIASVNAISDVYAMGGKPLMAIAILGWPIGKVSAAVAKEVLEGSRNVCAQAGIPLAGGHSIDCPEPVFGLAVTGMVDKKGIKRNDTALPGSLLYITKPVGVGIVTTAQKKNIVDPAHLKVCTDSMLMLNRIGAEFGELPYVNAMTDITGFGLLGHLCEVCEGSNLSATIEFDRVPRFNFLEGYIQQNSMPGGTTRNWESYGSKISTISDLEKAILADPQTSGGLLVVVDGDKGREFEAFANSRGLALTSFGKLTARSTHTIFVR